ncbi:MAG: hypothetical protein WCV71_02045 [Patescibacteria group bacterium]
MLKSEEIYKNLTRKEAMLAYTFWQFLIPKLWILLIVIAKISYSFGDGTINTLLFVIVIAGLYFWYFMTVRSHVAIKIAKKLEEEENNKKFNNIA